LPSTSAAGSANEDLIQRSLGISAPKGKEVYELYLVLKSRPGTLGKVSSMLGRRRIDILGAHLQVSDDGKKGYSIFYVEMARSSVSIEKLLDLLSKQEYVIEAKAESMEKVFFERFMFPTTSGGHYRVSVLGGASFVKLEQALIKQYKGTPAESILHGEGMTVGREIADGIRLRFKSPPDEETMIANFTAMFRASGLGLLHISRSQSGKISASLASTALAESNEPTIDHFAVGIIRGAISSILKTDYEIENLRLEEKKVLFNLSPAS